MTVDGSCNVASYDDYYPFGMIMDGRSANLGQGDTRYKFTEKERDVESQYDYFGARYYDARMGRFLSVDAHGDLYPALSPFSYVGNNPLIFIDPTGLDSVYFVDQANRPEDKGTPGTTYTATVYVVQNGRLVGVYKGSTYPNSVSNNDNSPRYNTVNAGAYPFNNESGHTPENKSTEKGLNLVDDAGVRTTPGTTPEGSTIDMSQVNVHDGTSDNGNSDSRGSRGCLTVAPEQAQSFFSHFDWSGEGGVTGNSTGTAFVQRGGAPSLPVERLNARGLPKPRPVIPSIGSNGR